MSASAVAELTVERDEIDGMLDDLHDALAGTMTAERERELLQRLEESAEDPPADQSSPDTDPDPVPDTWSGQVAAALQDVDDAWANVTAADNNLTIPSGSSPADVKRVYEEGPQLKAAARAEYEQAVLRAGTVIGERADQLIAQRLADAPPEPERLTAADILKKRRELRFSDPDAVAAFNALVRRRNSQLREIEPSDQIRAQAYRDVLNEVRPLGGATAKLGGQRPNRELVDQVSTVCQDLPPEWTTMINDVAAPLRLKKKSNARGYYLHSAQEIQSAELSTTYHELGHRMEYHVPQIAVATNQFLKRRTTGEDGAREPERKYGRARGSQERVRPDGFADSYIGKSYPGTPTEVFSCGVEALWTGAHGGLVGNSRDRSYASDLEHRNLMLGLYASALRPGQSDFTHYNTLAALSDE